MKRKSLSVILMLTVLLSLTVPAFAAGPYTVDFIGQEKVLEKEEVRNGQKIDVEINVYADTSVDRFDAAHLLFTFDSSIFRFVRGRTESDGYNVMAQTVFDSDGTCSLIILNPYLHPPEDDRFCCTCIVTLEIKDAEALQQAGRKVLNVSPWESDVVVTADEVMYQMQEEPEVFVVNASPVVVKVEGVQGAQTSQQTLSFNSNAFIPIESIEAAPGEAVELPVPEQEGYTFDGWYTDVKLTKPVDGTTYTPQGDETLYAKWTEVPATDWIVRFVTNGGEKLEALSVQKGASVQLPEPTKDGSKFLGWYTEAMLLNPVDEPYQPTEDIMLYAKWKTVSGSASDPDTSGAGTTEGDDTNPTNAAGEQQATTGEAQSATESQHGFPVLPVVIVAAILVIAAICAAVVIRRKKS